VNHRLAGLATLAICVLPSAAGAQEAEARFHGLAAGAILLGLAVLLQARFSDGRSTIGLHPAMRLSWRYR
jgi:hypothetical protein